MDGRNSCAIRLRRGRATARVAPALAILLTCAVVASGVAAKSTEVTTVTLIARSQQAPGLEAVIKRFEELYPNITIKPSYAASNAVATTILDGLAAGKAPDIMVLSTSGAGLGGLPSVWALGPRYLVDLTNRAWVKQLWPPILPLISVAGKIYAEPINTGSIQMVAYNKDLFAQLGVAPPKTWSELLALCNRIADQGKVPIKLAGGAAVPAGAIATALAANTVYTTEPNWSQKRNAGKVSFTGTPGWRQALQLMLDMKGARCFDPSPATVTLAAANAAFNAGQAAMTFNGGWDFIQDISPSVNIGFFPLPGASVKSTRVIVNPGEHVAVNAASPVKQQALLFLDFIARAWPSATIAHTENSVSSLQLMTGTTPPKLPLFAPFIKARQFVVSPVIWGNNPNAVAVFRTGITALLAGTKTIDQVLAEDDAAWA